MPGQFPFWAGWAQGDWGQNDKGPAVTGRAFEFGGAKRDRTADLYNAIVALSQLSYGPETVGAVWVVSAVRGFI